MYREYILYISVPDLVQETVRPFHRSQKIILLFFLLV